MKPACEQTLLAAQLLLEAVGEMKRASPPVDCQKMHIAAQKILEGTMKVGLLIHRNIGLLVHRNIGLLVHRNIGLLVHRNIGLLVQLMYIKFVGTFL